MNKKFSTLMAGLLLAGGLFSTADAIDLRNAVAGQYYQLKRTAQYQGQWGTTDLGDYFIVNKGGKYVLSKDVLDKNSYWTIEVKTSETGIKLVRLVNVYTNKALSVKTQDNAASTEWFEVNWHEDGIADQTSENDVNELQWGANKENYLSIKNNGGDYEFTSATTEEATEENQIWLQGIDAIPVDPAVLTAEKLNKLYENGFGMQICYQPLKNDGSLDTSKNPVEYADLLGNPFVGTLVVDAGSANDVTTTTGVAIYQGSLKGKRIVLTSETWGSQAGGTTQVGYKFAAYTESEYNANKSKIKADRFTIAQPAVKAGAPLEVATVIDGTKYELVVTIIENVNRLTVATSNTATKNVADYTVTNGTWTNAKQNTYVQFGISNLADYTNFYGKLWNITKEGKVASPACEGVEYIPASQVALTYPEGQWLFDATIDKDNDGVNEGAFVNRESGKILSVTNLLTVEGEEYTYTKNGETYTITPAGDPSDNYTAGYLAGYTEDQLKQKAFFIGTPIASTGDTVYLAKAANGKLEFTTDKTDAVEFRLTMADFDRNEADNQSFKTAKTITSYTVWKDKNAGTTEQKNDIVNYHQYWLEDAVSGECLSYDSDNERFVLAETGESFPFYPLVIKAKGTDTYNLLYSVVPNFEDTNSDGKNDTYVSNSAFCNSNKLYGAHSANELVLADGAYGFIENDLFVVVDADAKQYRGDFSNEGTLDTIKIFRNDDPSYVLYEKGTLLANAKGEAIEGFLGMENINDPKYAEMHAAMLADTASISNTYRPQYMLAVDAEYVADGWTCPLNPEHNTAEWREENGGHCADAVKDRPYVQGRYLVNLVDSANAATKAGIKFADNKFVHEYYNTEATPYYRLGFVSAKHIGDSLIIASTNDTIDLAANRPNDKVCTFAFKYVDANRDAFTIETLYRTYDYDEDGDVDDQDRGYIKYQNGVPVVTPKESEAWVFDLDETSETPTANEEIATSSVVVAGTNGAVVVKGAEGKSVIVSTILGKVVANEVLTSDNAQITAPAGVVVVSVDGESFKVVVK